MLWNLIRIQKMQFFAGPRRVIQIGEKTVDYNNDFRLYLCSKNNQMKLDQTVKAAITEICFSITQTGLASQVPFVVLSHLPVPHPKLLAKVRFLMKFAYSYLQVAELTAHLVQMLGLAIRIEKPDLETRSNELTRDVEQMKIKLNGIEQSLLHVCFFNSV